MSTSWGLVTYQYSCTVSYSCIQELVRAMLKSDKGCGYDVPIAPGGFHSYICSRVLSDWHAIRSFKKRGNAIMISKHELSALIATSIVACYRAK